MFFVSCRHSRGWKLMQNIGLVAINAPLLSILEKLVEIDVNFGSTNRMLSELVALVIQEFEIDLVCLFCFWTSPCFLCYVYGDVQSRQK